MFGNKSLKKTVTSTIQTDKGSFPVGFSEQAIQIDTSSEHAELGTAQSADAGSGVDWGCAMLNHKTFGRCGMQLCYSHPEVVPLCFRHLFVKVAHWFLRARDKNWRSVTGQKIRFFLSPIPSSPAEIGVWFLPSDSQVAHGRGEWGHIPSSV